MGACLFLKILFIVFMIPAVLESASILIPRAQGNWLFFLKNSWALLENAHLGKLAQGTKLPSWTYWGQTNGSLQEILSSCTHKESKLLMDALQFGLLLSSFLSNYGEQSFRKGFVYSSMLKRQHTRNKLPDMAAVFPHLSSGLSWLSDGRPRSSTWQAADYVFTCMDTLPSHMLPENFAKLKNKTK